MQSLGQREFLVSRNKNKQNQPYQNQDKNIALTQTKNYVEVYRKEQNYYLSFTFKVGAGKIEGILVKKSQSSMSKLVKSKSYMDRYFRIDFKLKKVFIQKSQYEKKDYKTIEFFKMHSVEVSQIDIW